MEKPTDERPPGPRVFVYRGGLPLGVGLLLLAPVLLVLLSVAAAIVAGSAVAALILPLVLRGRRRRMPRDPDCIELDRADYRHVEPNASQLPPR